MKAKREKSGRPQLSEGMAQIDRRITLDDERAELLRAFGNGNLSDGIRRAADIIRPPGRKKKAD